jgi:hypothetical protein
MISSFFANHQLKNSNKLCYFCGSTTDVESAMATNHAFRRVGGYAAHAVIVSA